MSSYNLSEEKKKRHSLSLVSRGVLEIDGVEEVLGFDDERVSLRTGEGGLEVEGVGLKVETLDTESGIVKLSGRVNAMYYESDTETRRRGFFRRSH